MMQNTCSKQNKRDNCSSLNLFFILKERGNISEQKTITLIDFRAMAKYRT